MRIRAAEKLGWMTRGYLLALIIIACLATGQMVVKRLSLRAAASSATVVNISGRQRMLSQRIALYVSRYRNELALGEAGPPETRDELRKATAEFLNSHEDLTTGSPGRGVPAPRRDNVLDAYFSGEPSLDRMVREYVNQAHLVLAASTVAETAQLSIFGDLPTELLGRLDQVVGIYEHNAREDVARIDRLQVWFWLLTLLTLVLEGLLIFRPIVRRTHTAIQARELERTRLADANAELKEFAYRTSHDLVAPLTSIQGVVHAARLLLDRGDDEGVRRALALIEDSAARARILIRDIKMVTVSDVDMALARMDEIRAIVEEVRDDLLAQARSCDVVIDTGLVDAGRVEVSATAVRKMVHNLLANAIAYADPSSDGVQVRVTLTKDSTSLRIAVEDNGVGIEPQHRDRLFQMFERFRPDLGNGSGLGLYLVRKLAQRHGGDVRYEPLPRGSRFTVILPAARSIPR